ncbi:MAG: SpoIIE family protein phosphatase [Spirochaetales bacterium]|nr:SpoIIE family protein phosphatase [Spirochaetales bacterium]
MKNFIEIDWSQQIKAGQRIGGDAVFLSRSQKDERNICILSDGLGSGVKANVLATMTGRMAQRYVEEENDLIRAAEIIMNTLPVCSERRISYATFTICDISPEGKARILEYDNPPFIMLRNGKVQRIDKIQRDLNRPNAFKKEKLLYSEVKLQFGDRLLFYSDGVTQAGLGTPGYPLGWRQNRVEDFIEKEMFKDRFLSARRMAQLLTRHASLLDRGKAMDDITALSIYFRRPREILVISGPPMEKKNDPLMAAKLRNFDGKKIISGGTTANLLSRELNKKLKLELKTRTKEVPPYSTMDGVDLVTEGMLTLTKVAEILENKEDEGNLGIDGASRFASMLINSDSTHFLIGTRVNNAHQDPSIPFEIGIRRTIVRRITQALEKNYLKQTRVEYI